METRVGEAVNELGYRDNPGIGGDDGSVIVQIKREKETYAGPERRTVFSQSKINCGLGSRRKKVDYMRTKLAGQGR